MGGRMIAIGDIHGCSKALGKLLDAIAPAPEDTIVVLGDFIDRGPDTCGVLEKLIALNERCVLIPLIGNHEEMFLDALRSPFILSPTGEIGQTSKENLRRWLASGGMETLRSYGWKSGTEKRSVADWIPESDRAFIAKCQSFHVTTTHMFLHAGYVPDRPLEEQPGLALRWRVTDPSSAVPHCSGKVVVVGHTPQMNGEVLNLGFLICIDTNCVRGGWLTALETTTGQVWQSDGIRQKNGKLRS